MHHIGTTNFRTKNIVKNMSHATSVKIIDDNHIIEFYTEYYDRHLKQIVPSNIKYAIKSDLVTSLKLREKIGSN